MVSPQPLSFDILAHRLSAAERQLAIDRHEIAALRRDVSGQRRSLWMANAFILISAVAAITLTRSPDLQAQKPQAQKAPVAAPMVVKAPFTVVDNENMPILRVQDQGVLGPRGALVFNDDNYSVAMFDVGESGQGQMHLANAEGKVLVEAGMTVGQTGTVRAGPASAPTAPGIPPSFILGVRK